MTNTKQLKSIHHRAAPTRAERLVKALLAALFVSYGLSMAVLLVFRGYQVAERELVLVPFTTIRFYFENYDLRAGALIINIWGNILTFVPLGILLQVFLKRQSVLFTVGLTALASFTAETLQYILRVGCTDIDDLILNTLGGLLGVLVYRVTRRLFKTQARTNIALLALLVVMCLFIWPMAFRNLSVWFVN